jgi:transposase
MPAAYSLDLRERVVGAVEGGLSRHGAAALFKVGVSSVIRWTKRLAETGSFAALPSGGDHRSGDIEAHAEWLLALVKAETDLSLEEIRTRLKNTHGLTKSVSCLWRFFARHNVTLKKNRARQRTGSAGRQRGTRPLARQPDGVGSEASRLPG